MRRHEVGFTEELWFETKIAAKRMHELILSARTPCPEYSKKCDSCSLNAQCLPKTIGKRRSVKLYLAKALEKG